MENKESVQKINKLFLIGNGLDLALGLETSYTDFMFWLLKKRLVETAENYGEQYASRKYRGKYDNFFKRYDRLIVYGFSSNELFDVLFNEDYDEIPNKIKSAEDLESLLEVIENYDISIKPKYERMLFSSIYHQCDLGWVDIEETYFGLIQSILNVSKKNHVRETVKELNDELELIARELVAYLAIIDTNIDNYASNKLIGRFIDEIHPDEIIGSKSHNTIEIDKLYFLNFNYTKSLHNVLLSNKKIYEKSVLNHIHGSLDNYDSIVFGYGDEMHEYYKVLEDYRDNEFLKHIKSFRYFQNKNYRDLLRFLNSSPFQVCVYGHSCDVSDRVMLNEIFEHENCVSIKIYFYKDKHGNPDFTQKTMNISRHFNSNKLMRKKIVEFNPDNEIPQIKK